MLPFPGTGDVRSVLDLVFDGSQFVALGEIGSSAGSSVVLAAYLPVQGIVWTSKDGKTWRRDLLQDMHRMYCMSIVEGGLIGVGGLNEGRPAR